MELQEYEDIKEVRERLDNNIKKLAKNESALGKEKLKSEKYIAAYTKLLKQIKTDTDKYVGSIVFAVMIPKSKSEIIVNQITQSGLMQSLNNDAVNAVYKDYDIEKLDEICTLYNQRVSDLVDKIS